GQDGRSNVRSWLSGTADHPVVARPVSCTAAYSYISHRLPLPEGLWIVATPVAPRVVAAGSRLCRTHVCKRSGPEPLNRERHPRSSGDCAQRRMALVGGLLLVASESVSRRCSMAEHGCTPVPCSTSCRSPVIVASSVTRKSAMVRHSYVLVLPLMAFSLL